MKVLISAYACEPGEGSEPGAGWSWAREAARQHEVWVMTRTNNAELVGAALREEPDLDFRPVYLDLPRWMQVWKKRVPWGVNLYYLCWQLLAYRSAKALHERERFDLAHHLTFAVDWAPAGVAFVPGLRVVWGPVGGATPTPWSLWKWFGLRGLALEVARTIVSGTFRRTFGLATARRSTLLVAQNEDVERYFNDHVQTVVAPNVAISAGDLALTGEPHAGKTAVFGGRLVAWKGIRIAIAAMAQPALREWTLEIFGSGPDERGARRLVTRLGLEDRVRFRGARPRSEYISAMASAEVFLFPSLHDSAPWAVAEALALGCHVVCIDRGGPPVIIGLAGHGSSVQEGEGLVERVAAAVATAQRGAPDLGLWERRMPVELDRWYSAAMPRLATQK